MRNRAKNDIALYYMIFLKCIGPDMFSWIRHYVAEVCALPSALLVAFVFEKKCAFCDELERLPLVPYLGEVRLAKRRKE